MEDIPDTYDEETLRASYESDNRARAVDNTEGQGIREVTVSHQDSTQCAVAPKSGVGDGLQM